MDHLRILRKFIYIFLIFIIGSFPLMYILLKNKIIYLFVKVLKSMDIKYINYLSVYDGFLLPLKLLFYLYIFLLIIIFIVMCFIFLEMNIINIYFLGLLPMIIYGNFKYLIPISWKNFYYITPLYGNYFITIKEVLNFIFIINLCGFIIFYMPFIFIVLYCCNIISENFFNIIKKYWWFISIVISGIIAPADIISHIIMSIFMILIFHILLKIVKLFK